MRATTQNKPRVLITTAGRGGGFLFVHYYILAGQTKVPDPNVTVITMKEDVPWLWKKYHRN